MPDRYTRPYPEQLAHLRMLEDDWDTHGAPAPTAAAIDRAQAVLNVLPPTLRPSGICPAAEGGAALFFRPHNTYFDVAFLNDGTQEVAVIEGGVYHSEVISADPTTIVATLVAIAERLCGPQ